MVGRRFCIAAAGAALALLPRAVRAQSQPGRVATRSFARLPSPLVVAIAPLDDSAENLRVRDEMRRVLVAAGHRVVDGDAVVRLSFATEVRPAIAADRGPPRQDPGAVLPDRPVAVPRDRPPGSMGRSLRYVINAALEQGPGGKRLWQGNVRYDDAEPDRARVLVRLVAPLLAELGRTVPGRRFSLD